MWTSPRKLILFDLDETLCFRKFVGSTIYRYDNGQAVHNINGNLVIPRPGLWDFIEALFSSPISKVADIGVYTSCMAKNAIPICKFLFGEYYDGLKVLLHRDHCVPSPTPDKPYTTKKDISILTETNQVTTAIGCKWERKNILIVDNSPEKHTRQMDRLVRIDSFMPCVDEETGIVHLGRGITDDSALPSLLYDLKDSPFYLGSALAQVQQYVPFTAYSGARVLKWNATPNLPSYDYDVQIITSEYKPKEIVETWTRPLLQENKVEEKQPTSTSVKRKRFSVDKRLTYQTMLNTSWAEEQPISRRLRTRAKTSE